jgi:hypothetical protein
MYQMPYLPLLNLVTISNLGKVIEQTAHHLSQEKRPS